MIDGLHVYFVLDKVVRNNQNYMLFWGTTTDLQKLLKLNPKLITESREKTTNNTVCISVYLLDLFYLFLTPTKIH